jgi:glycosyltransferase involved in cell wall biosynthesis
MLRVAFDATPLVGERTGVGVLTRGAFTALAGRPGLDLRAFALTWRGRSAVAGAVPAGIAPVRLPLAAVPLQQAWARFDGPVIEWWTGPIDVVHGTNFVVPPAARAAEVVSVHDLTAVRFPELCQPATLRYPTLIRRAIRRGAWVHALSQAMAEEIADLLGAPAERIRVVAPGVDPGPVASPIESGPPYILALGRVEPRKDLPLLVRAFDQIAAGHGDLELVIAGPPGWGSDALAATIASAQHRDRVRRLGWVGDVEKAGLLAGAAVFAYPSVYEGFGISPLEAMAAGVVVVATATGGVPEAVGDAALLVPAGDTDGLAAALVTALDDGAVRARLRAAGRERAAAFSWGRCADGLEALYREAAASSSRH